MIRNAKDRDRNLARGGDIAQPEGNLDDDIPDGIDATKIIVIHLGSQNMRIGRASDALPKTIPMCISYASHKPLETEEYAPRPVRLFPDGTSEEMFGEDFTKKHTKLSNDLAASMRANKRNVLPKSKTLVKNFNAGASPDLIPEHNDPHRAEWTDVSHDAPKNSNNWIGLEAQRIPEDARQKETNRLYRLRWPIQHGWLNELEFASVEGIVDEIENILWEALKEIKVKDTKNYDVVFVVPDLYDKKYMESMLRSLLIELEFKQVAFIQEGLAAQYGAGYSMNCIVDIGAQKTSISCIDDGMIIEDSRINLKYGGFDVTETFIKMMLCDNFPYRDINLVRRHDFLLAEELKIKICTMDQADISVQTQNFHLRAPNKPTYFYKFKTYDEPILAPMGFFDPSYFNNKTKLAGRRKLIARSYNAYDPDQPNDPESSAQLAILSSIQPLLANTAAPSNGNDNGDLATPQKEKSNPLNHFSKIDSQTNDDSRVTSAAGSPAPEGFGTPVPAGPFVFGANGDSPAPSGAFQFGNGSHHSGTPGPGPVKSIDPQARTLTDFAEARDAVLPIAALDVAIMTSIAHAAKGDDRKARDFYGNIMLVGGGAKTPGLTRHLEEKLKVMRPDIAEKILVGLNPREIDAAIVTWKGASIYSKLHSHESWVGQQEFEMLGSRALQHKVLWHWN